MISDGKGTYIRKNFAGKYSPVRNETLGEVWEQKSKAKNVLENQLNKNIRKRYHIVETEIPDVRKIANDSEMVPRHCSEMIKRMIGEGIEDSQIDKWRNGIDYFSPFIHDLEQRKENLSNKLSDVDKEIIDIQHYIEFGDKFNAYEGWLAFSMLRHRLKKRRKIKDELYIVTQLSECKINSSMLSNIKDIIYELDKRVYTPRKLANLFEKGVNRQ